MGEPERTGKFSTLVFSLKQGAQTCLSAVVQGQARMLEPDGRPESPTFVGLQDLTIRNSLTTVSGFRV